MKRIWRITSGLIITAMLLLSLATPHQMVKAAPTDLFFSEYIEGSSNNKALEIYNGTGAAIDLATGGYNIKMYFNGNPSAGLTINLGGVVANGDAFIIAHSSANATILAQANQTNGAGWFNGDDAVALYKGAVLVDVIGQIGVDPGSQWGSGDTSTADNTLRRKAAIETGDTNGGDAFDPSVEWNGYPTDTFTNLGYHFRELLFTEYIEGSSNNKALEIYNGTGAAIDLATGSYNIKMYFNGNPISTLTINLSGTVADGDVFVIAQSSANPTILAQADQTNGSGWFNGDDAVALYKGAVLIDVIGQIGYDPGSQWGSGDTSTADNTLRRKLGIMLGDADGSNVFDPSVEWIGYANDTFSGLGAYSLFDSAPSVSLIIPSNASSGVAVNTNITLTFNEPVTVSGAWFDLTCTVSGSLTAAVSGGPTTFTIDPASDLDGSEDCVFTVYASQVTDVDLDDPPDMMQTNFSSTFSTVSACLMGYTPIHNIQGAGSSTPIPGAVTTQGIVIGDYEGASPALRGFYIQAIPGTEDADELTSEGIFVFNGNNDSVSVGQLVRVTGTASEYYNQTQISASTITQCGTGLITPTPVSMPFPAADYLERFESMLVFFPQTLYVTEHFQLDRFGEVLLSSGDRLWQPTSLALPGATAAVIQAANDLNQIFIDDGTNVQNPDPIVFARGGLPLSASNTLRGGDTATGLIGVMTFTYGGASASPDAFRIRPIYAMNGIYNFTDGNPRPSNTPPSTGGNIRIVGMNFLNYFNTFDGIPDVVDNCSAGVGGTAVDCRGADDATEFTRQYTKIVNAIIAMSADIIGMTEIENDGYGASSAIQDIVDRLNAVAGAGTYAFIDPDVATGNVNSMGTDAIKNGIIYRTTTVAPAGTTAVLNTGAFGIFTLTTGTSQRNRPAIAQTFELLSNGGYITIAVNHLKSKGSGCVDNVAPVPSDPDLLDGQGNCNLTRTAAANELTAWLAGNPTGIVDSDNLIIGDLNSYAMEDPIRAIEGAGYTNLVSSFLGANAYSYVFDGQWGYLDHALSSASLTTQVTGVLDWHLNSDEPDALDYNTDYKSAAQITNLYSTDPFRYSDHDPVLIGINLISDPPQVAADGVTTGAEVITDGVILDRVITTLGIQFTEDVNNAGGGTSADDAANPNNYLLVRSLFDGITTNRCDTGVAPGDMRITVNSVTYDPVTFTATLQVHNGLELPNEKYRLIVCGTTSITDLYGIPLAGDGVNARTDYIIDFEIAKTVSALLPSTGFPIGQVSTLPGRSNANTYDSSGIEIIIPKLGKTLSVFGVAQVNGGWDASWLGTAAGWLEGSAYPTWEGNTVITAHVWTAMNEPGPFYNLKTLLFGDRFTIKSGGYTYTYEVRENMLVGSKNYGEVFKHRTGDWVTLLTCEGYSSISSTYPFRRIVRAVLINVTDIP